MVCLQRTQLYSVIASEREATQLMLQNRAQRNHSTLENSVSWVASLIARNDGWGLLARTDFVNAGIVRIYKK